MKPFLTDIKTLRKRAREHIKRGALTPGYEGDLETTIRLLNEALATEIVCTLRYRHHYYMADGLHAKSVAGEFLEHAAEEADHADRIAKRIRQLGGNPNLNPEGLLTRSHAEYQAKGSQVFTLIEMIEEDLIAERIAIDTYREMIRYFGEKDPTSRRMMEEILAKEEEHAEDLSSLLQTFDSQAKPSVA